MKAFFPEFWTTFIHDHGGMAAHCQRKPDIVIATSPQFFRALAGWFTALVRRKPFLLEIREMLPASIVAVGAMKERLFIRLMEKPKLLLYRLASQIVVVTQAFKREMVQRGMDAKKISVVLNGVYPSLFHPIDKDTRSEVEATAIVEHTESGLTVLPEDPVAMAAAIESLYTDPHALRRLKQHCSDAARPYSRDQLASDMLELIEQGASVKRAVPVSHCS